MRQHFYIYDNLRIRKKADDITIEKNNEKLYNTN